MAAKILTTLMQTVTQALSSDTKIDEVRYWSDSMTVLYWIQNKGKWKTFVRHMVNEILKASRKDQQGHVVGTENPADIGSRGPLAEQLKDNQLWWEGPSCLKENRDKWPSNFMVDESNDVIEERKKTVATVMQKVAKKDFNTAKLRVEEIKEAKREWIIDAHLFLQDNKDFAKYKDQSRRIYTGRFEYSDLEFDAKNPIILPKNHGFTDLVIMDCHVKVHHCRVSATLAELRSRYWITQGRQYVKRLLKKCFTCKKVDGKPFNNTVAQLPDFRVNEAPPFSKVGVDFAAKLLKKFQVDKQLVDYMESRQIHWRFNLPRPLTYLWEERQVLTPSHLMLGRRLTPFSANLSLDSEDNISVDNLTKRFVFLRKKLIHFWNRWKREYLVSLREQHQMNKKPSNAIGKGDMALMQDDKKKRIEWKLGIVEELIAGKDGEVRGVSIRVSNKGKTQNLHRPVQKVYPLEISDRAKPYDCTGSNAEENVEGKEQTIEVSGKTNEVNENGD
eukprot:gene6426-biopygen4756